MRTTNWKNEALLLSIVLVWGLNFPIVKGVMAVMPPHALNAFRFVCSAVVLGGVYVHRQRRAGQALFAPLRRHLWAIAGLGLLSLNVYGKARDQQPRRQHPHLGPRQWQAGAPGEGTHQRRLLRRLFAGRKAARKRKR